MDGRGRPSPHWPEAEPPWLPSHQAQAQGWIKARKGDGDWAQIFHQVTFYLRSHPQFPGGGGDIWTNLVRAAVNRAVNLRVSASLNGPSRHC